MKKGRYLSMPIKVLANYYFAISIVIPIRPITVKSATAKIYFF